MRLNNVTRYLFLFALPGFTSQIVVDHLGIVALNHYSIIIAFKHYSIKSFKHCSIKSL